MKKSITKKVYIDPLTFEEFKKLANEKGVKIQAYIGQLIENEVLKETTHSEIPSIVSPFVNNEPLADGRASV